MRWQDRGRSRNLEDRRGAPARRRGAQVGGVGLVIAIVAALLGKGELVELLGLSESGSPSGATTESAPIDDPASEEMVRFLSFLIDDMEESWTRQLASAQASFRAPYQAPKLVIFRDGVDSACGYAGSAVGPFYCPGDRKVYLDLSFFDDLSRDLGAKGDFARAYVVGHEIGHHLQTLLGISPRMRAAQQQRPSEKNALSIKLELQADCLSGVWAHDAEDKGLLEPGDIREALDAAMAIGDDTLQRRATGTVRPESWTHGSSAERKRWFRVGYESGQIEACDTFGSALD